MNIVKDKLAIINPQEIADFLSERKWHKEKTKDVDLNVFQCEKHGNFNEVKIPTNKDNFNYYNLLYVAISKICEVENLPLDSFINYLIKNKIPIYTITCLSKLEENNSWPDFGATAFMGFYHDFDDATESVMENCCDINETCYNYAVVEEILPGVYAYPRPRWFYKFNREKNIYEPIEEPKFMNHIANVL